MVEVLGYDESEVTFSKYQSQNLLSRDPSSPKTLLSPDNLKFFFEKFKQGNFEAIRKRFSYNAPINDKQIRGIYYYLEKVRTRQLIEGTIHHSTEN